ncbi:magnesium/cobalt transporter CorA [Chitinophagaceae bacterium MMS25-I14]
MARKTGISRYIPEWALSTRSKPLTPYNPTKAAGTTEKTTATIYTIFDYDERNFEEKKSLEEQQCAHYLHNGRITWINVDGLKKKEVEHLCAHFSIHPLVVEDILSIGQRAKMDEVGDIIFCLLPMLYFNDNTGEVEAEQVSMAIGKEFLISFQEDPERDVFDPVREHLRGGNMRLRSSHADYLGYSLLDVIVDSYFNIIEKLNRRIEALEDDLIARREEGTLNRISMLRREVMVMKRAIQPVRELVNSFIKTDNSLIEERNVKYFKDVSDHIIQANEYCENLRDMLMNLQDLYMNQINLRMNEVMKIFTMVALLLAPATVIGGIFGMNFDAIPGIHNREGFFISVGAMLIIPVLMLIYFKRKKWF